MGESRHAHVLAVYQGSDGDATKSLYARLAALGPAGEIGVNLFRACKASERAKVYRGRGFRGAAYDRKSWALGLLSDVLLVQAQDLGLRWGWKIDPKQPVHCHVLYVDLPTGQVSFHSGSRTANAPEYPGEWDEARGQTADRITRWCAKLLDDDVKGRDWNVAENQDPVVEAVRADLLSRSQFGLAKYGVGLDRSDLSLRDWLQHAYEETLDQANYLKRAILEIDNQEAGRG